MLVTRAYETELDLNNVQNTVRKRYAGAARGAYTWGLRRKQVAHQAMGMAPSARDLHRDLTVLKRTGVPSMASSPWTFEGQARSPKAAGKRVMPMRFGRFLARWPRMPTFGQSA